MSVCWGNSHEFLKVKSGGPFDGIDWSRDFWGFGDFWGFNTAFGDLDGDGDLDLVVGDWNGKLYFLDNVGSALRPEFVAAGQMSPFDQIDVGLHAAPVLADLDGDGKKLCQSFDEPPTHSARRRPGPNRRRK